MNLTKAEILKELRKRFDQSILNGTVDINMKEYRFLIDFFNTYFEKFSKSTLLKIYSEDFDKVLYKFKEIDFNNIEMSEGETN